MATNNVVLNPFGNSVTAVPSSMPSGAVMQSSDAARSVAEVQAALMIARMNPRDQRVSMDRIINACTRSSLAESAIYSYPRGGQSVTGPSIRLAEAIAQQWGNMQFGIRELSSNSKQSEVQAFAWDVETNVRREVTFTVPHIRYTRSGGKKLEDPRDIYEMVANQGARRLRACILAVIPGDVVEAAVQQCGATLASQEYASKEGIKKMIDTFKTRFGVTQDQIEEFFGCRAEAINGPQIVRLRGIYSSLKDGMSVPEDWFKPKTPGKIASDKKPTLKDKLKAREEAKAETAAAEEPQLPLAAAELSEPAPISDETAAETNPQQE